MATYDITGPDGKTYRITAPEDASEDQVLAYARSQFAAGEKDVPGGLEAGVMDPFYAGAQLLEKSLPKKVVSSINEFNNWLADRGVPLARLPEGGLSQQIKEGEAAYQQARADRGETGMDWPRLAGNILSPANLALASRLPVAASTGGKIATGMLGGAAMGPLQSPSVSDDFWGEKAAQAGLGAAGGAAVPAVSTAMSRMVWPRISEPVKRMRDEAIRLTPGQRLGGIFKDIEDKMTSIPVLGHAIQRSRAKGYDDFNRNLVKKGLARVGKTLPGDVETGQRSLSFLQSELGKSYDDLLSTMKGRVDSGLQKEVGTVFEMAKTLPDDVQKYLTGVVEREINGRITKAGTMSGRSIKEIQSALGNEIASIRNPSGWDQKKKDALIEIRESFMRMVARQNPGEKAKNLRKIDKSWREFEVMTRAASSVAAEDGIFTPAQLYNASKALDRSKNKRAFAQGRASLQEYAGAGKKTLPSKVPDSGTPGRLMMSSPLAGLGSAAMSAPLVPLYSEALRTPIDVLLSQRPGFAQPMAELIERGGRYAIPGGAAAAGMFGPAQ